MNALLLFLAQIFASFGVPVEVHETQVVVAPAPPAAGPGVRGIVEHDDACSISNGF